MTIDKRYVKKLEERIENACHELGQAKNIKECEKLMKIRNEKTNNLREYMNKFGEFLFPYIFEDSEKLGLLKITDPRYIEIKNKWLMNKEST